MCIGLTGLVASIDRMGGQPQRAEADGRPAPRIVAGRSDALTDDIAAARAVAAELV
jgi:hypothetical protein